MKQILYYAVTLGLDLIALVLFRKQVNLQLTSVVPLFLMALMAFQAGYASKEKNEKGFGTAYASGATEEEASEQQRYLALSLAIGIPFLLPFVFFFSTYLKLISCLLYILFFGGGPICYRIKHRKNISARQQKERDALAEQRKKEEMGQWK